MPKTACIETFGCQMNVHDSERMAGLLEQAGYEIVHDVDIADLVILNTCSVREKAEEKLFSRLGEIRKSTAKHKGMPLVAVTGCVAQQEGDAIIKRAGMVDVVVGTQALRRLPVLVSEAEHSGQPQVDTNPYDDVSFPLGIAVRHDPVKAYVTIIEGCNDYCAFCVVPYTRGHERMRPVEEVVREVKQAADTGHSEIHLLGQIVNHYHAPDDPGCDFASLLHRVHAVRGVKRIRFASPHPRHVTQAMLEAIRDLTKVCKHLHLPVQSGATAILTRMRRRHTREDYLDLVERVRKIIPDVTLSTDIIVGFPGESQQHFEETVSLTERVRYHSMFSFKYSERPNTLARFRMADTVPAEEKSRRLAVLQQVQMDIQSRLLMEYVGRTVDVLVDSKSRRRSNEVSGRTTGNTVVNFTGQPEWIGQMVPVRVCRAGPNSLWGEAQRTCQ